MTVSCSNIRFSRATALPRPRRKYFVPSLDPLESRLAPSATYYVSPSGNDSNDGLYEWSAWRTLNRVNTYQPRPGDTILLQGGQTFSGTLQIARGDSSNPITIDSYGGDRATISSGDASAIIAASPGGLHLYNLRLVGSGVESGSRIGLELANDGTGHAANFVMQDVEVTGYGLFGIYIWSDAYGLSDLTLRRVDAHHNANGIQIGAGGESRFTNVLLSEVRAYENDRLSDSPVTGFGVAVVGLIDAVIERSIFAHNGLAGPGPGHTGLHVQESHNLRIEHNEAYGNWDLYWGDGIGIVVAGVQDTVVQYNYTHGNRGAGILVWTDEPGQLTERVTVRYNISENDTAGLNVSGLVLDSDFYNNTVFADAQEEGVFRSAVNVMSWVGWNMTFRNNIFVTAGNAPQVMVDDKSMPSAASLVFQNNAYYYATSPASIYVIFGGQGYYSLLTLRLWTGNELLFGLPVGFHLDPALVNPGGGGVIGNPWDLASLSAYQLTETSLLRSVGLDLLGIFGTAPGSHDFYGQELPEGLGLSLGAYQAAPGTGAAAPPGAGGSALSLVDAHSLLSLLEESGHTFHPKHLDPLPLPAGTRRPERGVPERTAVPPAVAVSTDPGDAARSPDRGCPSGLLVNMTLRPPSLVLPSYGQAAL